MPAAFLGLSVEWDSVAAYAGPAGRRRGALPALLAPLGPLALRVGGDTSDQAWWNPRGFPRPPTVLQDVTPATLDAVGWLARRLHGPVTLGLNLALGDPANALALARAARRRLPVEALEIGNEPDLYTRSRVVRVPGHVHQRLRKRRHYDPAGYGRDAGRLLAALSSGLTPTPRLVVAGFAGDEWWPALPRLLASWRGEAGALAGHLYAVPTCKGPAPPASWLLTAEASRGRAALLAPLAALARRHALPMRVSELNSAACGGRPGLSDTFGAALWLDDTLFALLRVGAQQVDVHTWNHARYAPFAVAGRGAQARPPLAGMLAFHRAAPAGSRLIDADVSGADALRAWATSGRDGIVRVALIAPHAARVRVHAGAGQRCAALWTATAAGTRNGPVCPRHGRYPISLPARSLAVLTARP